jgi:PIN domain nuclease of toxin-antitoxin system
MAVTADSLTFVRVCALLLVALCLVPGGAHVSELPNKIGLPRDHYMLVQQIYRGWALFGIVIFAALAATAAQALLLRQERTAFRLSLSAFLCLAAAQAVFWLFTYPVNVASANWTRIPEDFEAARRQWEYSHAAGAALTGAALIALIFCHVRPGRGD